MIRNKISDPITQFVTSEEIELIDQVAGEFVSADFSNKIFRNKDLSSKLQQLWNILQEIYSNDLALSRISGVIIFLTIVFWTLRVRPKLLGLSDYFITLCLVTLITVNVIDLSGYGHSNSLTHIQLWLLFPILMIFGIEYKTSHLFSVS